MGFRLEYSYCGLALEKWPAFILKPRPGPTSGSWSNGAWGSYRSLICLK